jgi:beta-glucosidase
MRLNKVSAIALLGASLAAVCGPVANAQASPFSVDAGQTAEALLKQMTLDEKVGQLNDSTGIIFSGFFTDQKLNELIIQSKGRSL